MRRHFILSLFFLASSTLVGCSGEQAFFKGPLDLTVTFYYTDNLKPKARIRYEKEILGTVQNIEFEEDTGLNLVSIRLEHANKKYALTSTKFHISSSIMGLKESYMYLTISDFNAESLSNGARLKGTESIGGKIGKLKEQVRRGAKAVTKKAKATLNRD
jgi:hypothetical protein